MMCDLIRQKDSSLRQFFVDGNQYCSQNTNLSSLLDGEKVSNITKSKLKKLLTKPCFSEEDKSYIKELRRKYRCRQTSKKHRDSEKVLEISLEIEIDCLKWEKEALKEEKECLKTEIKDLKMAF